MAITIQRWWRFHHSVNYLKTDLTQDILQELSTKCYAINNSCKGDGAGLSSGGLVDMLISAIFKYHLVNYEEFHHGESDMKIWGVPFSQKKINGKSSLALNWSKNKSSRVCNPFNSHIIIINLKTSKWWKHVDEISAGIYFINKEFCKKNIRLTCNNKTDTLIDCKEVYKMLTYSIQNSLYILFPAPHPCKFDITKAFLE
jgi:hypothetical protein